MVRARKWVTLRSVLSADLYAEISRRDLGIRQGICGHCDTSVHTHDPACPYAGNWESYHYTAAMKAKEGGA